MKATPSAAPGAPTQQFATILGSTIESIVHDLLFSRSVYPPDSFAFHRHLGVRCHASRVPRVGEYVGDFLRVAVPAVVSGAADGLSLVILEEEAVDVCGDGGGGGDGGDVTTERTGRTATVERFVFDFRVDDVVGADVPDVESSNATEIKIAYDDMTDDGDAMDVEERRRVRRRRDAARRDGELAESARAQLELSMKDCLLRVIALRRRRRRRGERPENMSFKLCLHVADADGGEEDHGDDAAGTVTHGKAKGANSCPELLNALQQGEWLQPEESSCLFSYSSGSGGAERSSKGLLRPIKDINLQSCGMRMQLGMEVNPL